LEEAAARLWLEPFLVMEAVGVVKAMDLAPALVLLIKDLLVAQALQAQQIILVVALAVQEVWVQHQTIVR
jgi:hypothetical protein